MDSKEEDDLKERPEKKRKLLSQLPLFPEVKTKYSQDAVLTCRYVVRRSLFTKDRLAALQNELGLNTKKYCPPGARNKTVPQVQRGHYHGDRAQIVAVGSLASAAAPKVAAKKEYDVQCCTYDKDYVYVPRYWGIANFGKPKNILLSRGQSMKPGLKYTVPLDEETRKQKTLTSGILDKLKHCYGAVLSAPPATGKTNMGLFLAFKLGRKTLWIQHKDELLQQSTTRAKSIIPGIRTGIIQAGQFAIENTDIVFATVQTLYNILFKRTSAGSGGSIGSGGSGGSSTNKRPPIGREWLDQFGTVIIDEYHHYAAATFEKVVSTLRPLNLIGLSASTERSDGLISVVHWSIGPVVTVEIKRTQTVRVEVWSYNNPPLTTASVSKKMPDHMQYAKLIKALIDDPARNARGLDRLVWYWFKCPRRNFLILSLRTQHIEDLRTAFVQRLLQIYTLASIPLNMYLDKSIVNVVRKYILPKYLPAEVLDLMEIPFTSTEEIQTYLLDNTAVFHNKSKLRGPELVKRALFSTCQMMAEGIDLAHLDTLFFMMHPSNTFQCLGRIIRKGYKGTGSEGTGSANEAKNLVDNPYMLLPRILDCDAVVVDIRDSVEGQVQRIMQKRFNLYRKHGFVIDWNPSYKK